MCAICAISRYNSLKMVTVWNMLKKFENVEYEGMTPLADVVASVESNPGGVEAFQMKMGELSPNTAYESTVKNVTNCWLMMLLFVVVFAILAMIVLRRIDRDRR